MDRTLSNLQMEHHQLKANNRQLKTFLKTQRSRSRGGGVSRNRPPPLALRPHSVASVAPTLRTEDSFTMQPKHRFASDFRMDGVFETQEHKGPIDTTELDHALIYTKGLKQTIRPNTSSFGKPKEVVPFTVWAPAHTHGPGCTKATCTWCSPIPGTKKMRAPRFMLSTVPPPLPEDLRVPVGIGRSSLFLRQTIMEPLEIMRKPGHDHSSWFYLPNMNDNKYTGIFQAAVR